jgi:FlaA1/EpsC-like NDP-sugar epimerase
MNLFKDKRIVITGGTGSLGAVLLRHILMGALGKPKKIVIFSRDEAKQHALWADYQMRPAPIREAFNKLVNLRVGDIRDYYSVVSLLKDADIVFNAAALKQVPTCEYHPFEAVRTNIEGAQNIIRAIETNNLPVQTVVGISTDKACKPVNVMGMTKALQERLFIEANLRAPRTRFVCARYGNVLASRGSVVPLFQEQIKNGGPVTITNKAMTRFLLSLDEAVLLILRAAAGAAPGDIYVPIVPSALIVQVAKALIGAQPIKIKETGIRPGEKTHEILVSEEEAPRTFKQDSNYVIVSSLPELAYPVYVSLKKEYSSADDVLRYNGVVRLLQNNGFIN